MASIHIRARSCAPAFLAVLTGFGLSVCISEGSVALAGTLPPRAIGALPASQTADLSEFRRQVDQLYRMKERAFEAGDPTAIVQRFYTRDAISIGPDGGASGTATIGRDALLQSYSELMKTIPATVRIEPFRTHVGRDAAWEWVNFHFIPKDSKAKPMTSLMIFIFAKGAEGWVSGGDAFVVTESPFPIP